LPDTRRHVAPERLLESPAVRLFVDRARVAKPGFRLTDDNAAAVVAICTRLDGLPLALELAAARSDRFTPAQMLGRLSGDAASLHLLDGDGTESADRPARHQTLRDAIEWSYRLLTPEEQQLFAQLA